MAIPFNYLGPSYSAVDASTIAGAIGAAVAAAVPSASTNGAASASAILANGTKVDGEKINALFAVKPDHKPEVDDDGFAIIDAQAVRDAIGLASNNLDAQFSDLPATLSSQHGGGSWQAEAIVGIAPVIPPLPISGAALSARVAHTFSPPPFVLVEDDSAGWTAWEFIVKKTASGDSDSEALILIRVSNPSATGDGLIRQNGRAAASAADGSILVGVSGGDTMVTIIVTADGMNIPSSPGPSFPFELVRWKGSIKEAIGEGTINVASAVSRSTTAA